MKKSETTIETFLQSDIRVGLVTSAEPVPNSKKLIKLTVDLGESYGTVIILTGLLAYFPDPTVFIGKKYLFLANLAPRTMAGVASQGMFLAADAGTGDAHPTPVEVAPTVPVGAWVH